MTTYLEADAAGIEACCKANNPASIPRQVLVSSIQMTFKMWERIKINRVTIVEVSATTASAPSLVLRGAQ